MSRFSSMNLYKSLLILCFSLFLLHSCKKPQNNTLVVHILNEPDDMHPVNGASAVRAEINLYTHLSLLKVNYATGELLPCMVKELPSVSTDGLSYTYEIKDYLFWDDKSPVTSADVVFTTHANKCLLTNNMALKSYWDNVKSITVDEKNTKAFTVVMNKPYVLNTWFWTDFPIIQESFYDTKKVLKNYTNEQLLDSTFIKTKKDVQDWAKEFNDPKYYSNPAFISGGGPYKITKWDKGISLTLEKKKDHWSEAHQEDWFCQAYPDKIIFKLNSNNASTKLELKNGLIDMSTMVDYASFSELAKDEAFTKNYFTKLSDTYNYLYVAMNLKPDGQKHKHLFDDVLVRRAMALLTPYDQINKLVYENNCKRMMGPISSLKTDFNTDLKPLEYNVVKAKELLKQAGWADTDNDQILDKKINGEKVKLEFDINFMNMQKQWEDIAKQMAESMQKANIFAKLNPVDYNGFVTAATSHDFDMSIGAWQSNAQPEDYSQLWHSNSWKNNGLNFTGFGDATSDALIDSINKTVDEPKRIALSKQFQKLVYDQQPYIFLFAQTRRVVINKKWDNIAVFTEYPGVLVNTLKLKD
jgi:peptide/nickel transport system substrate-binding protein